jgi:hypothetical protein
MRVSIPTRQRSIMIVTEYAGHTQGFLVEGVDTILRLDWSQMRVPPAMLLAEMGGLVTAVTELPDGRLVMMMDVEKILSETTNYDDEIVYRNIKPLDNPADGILCRRLGGGAQADQRTLEAMGVKYVAAINGREAWLELEKMAAYAQASGSASDRPDQSGIDRYRDARDGWLHPDQEDQVRPALRRRAGDHAFLLVRDVEPATGQIRRRR